MRHRYWVRHRHSMRHGDKETLGETRQRCRRLFYVCAIAQLLNSFAVVDKVDPPPDSIQ